jgi:CDP-diacylglycerol--glycerol-3-phosphate 3-phosphatidyltransferase
MKLTTASKITILRVFLIPVVLILMYADFRNHMLWAVLVFVVASGSDFLDGYIARHYDQVSNFGKFLDPLADKMLVISVMLVFVGWGLMPAWAVIVVIVRELAVTGLRLVAVEGGKVIAAAWSGKIKTAARWSAWS